VNSLSSFHLLVQLECERISTCEGRVPEDIMASGASYFWGSDRGLFAYHAGEGVTEGRDPCEKLSFFLKPCSVRVGDIASEIPLGRRV